MNNLRMSCLALALLWPLLPATSGARSLHVTAYLDLEKASNPQISPNGETIVYTRSWVNVQQDFFEKQLLVMDSRGGHNHSLIKGGKEAQWSPDSSRVAYLDQTETGDEIFVRWMDTSGATSQITRQ